MKASRNALIPLICIALIAVDLAAGVVELKATGSNTISGVAFAEGDIIEPGSDASQLYTGAWAHVYVPAGNGGVNSGESIRTVDGRTDTRTYIGANNEYSLTNTYGDSTVIAKASKTGVLGVAEAFAEVSTLSSATDGAAIGEGEVSGYSQLAAYVSHTGTGTANASATGSSEYTALMSTVPNTVQASGSVSGSVALDAANNYGGLVQGAALKASRSAGSTIATANPFTESESFEYLSLTSGRNALSAKSTIEGIIAGDTSANGFFAKPAVPASDGQFGNSDSSATGDLSATATTYKLGDSIAPSAITTPPNFVGLTTQLDTAAHTAITGNLYDVFLGGTPDASAYLMSQSSANWDPDPATQDSRAQTESFTSAAVTRTLVDTNEAYGASYIDNGALSATADTASQPGLSPITLASAEVDTIFMGSGAHLVSRLTGAWPVSYADLNMLSVSRADGTGSVQVTGDSANTVLNVVGPSYSPSGTYADATGSYLTALNIAGTAVHAMDVNFPAPTQLIADDISEINIWSWIAGNDPISHAESAYGLSPFVSTPVYTADPANGGTNPFVITKTTTGPTATPDQEATSRSITTAFNSEITAV